MKNFDSKLTALRDEIDGSDSQLVALLAKRRAVTTKVGQLKAKWVCLFMRLIVKLLC